MRKREVVIMGRLDLVIVRPVIWNDIFEVGEGVGVAVCVFTLRGSVDREESVGRELRFRGVTGIDDKCLGVVSGELGFRLMGAFNEFHPVTINEDAGAGSAPLLELCCGQVVLVTVTVTVTALLPVSAGLLGIDEGIETLGATAPDDLIRVEEAGTLKLLCKVGTLGMASCC